MMFFLERELMTVFYLTVLTILNQLRQRAGFSSFEFDSLKSKFDLLLLIFRGQ